MDKKILKFFKGSEGFWDECLNVSVEGDIFGKDTSFFQEYITDPDSIRLKLLNDHFEESFDDCFFRLYKDRSSVVTAFKGGKYYELGYEVCYEESEWRLARGVYNIANGNQLMIEATMGDYEVSSSVFKMNEEFYTTSVTVYVEGELKIVVSGLEAKFNEGT